MAAPYGTGVELRAALVEHGLLVPTSVPGLYHHSGAFEEVVQAVLRYAAAQRTVPDAPRRWFPPVLPRADFVRTDYVRSFPDLLGSVEVFDGGDEQHKELLATLEHGGDWTAALHPADVVLSSSVCHSLYGTLPVDVPAEGLDFECAGYSFRHEPSTDPARMQSFRIHEFVRIGTPEQAAAHHAEWRVRAHAALADLGLPARLEVAHDPFFGRTGRLLAAQQVEADLKFEIVVDLTDERPTAVGSVNYHEAHFGTCFGLRTPDGAYAHSACVGFGLERISLALFAVHGPDLGGWPASVRGRLGC